MKQIKSIMQIVNSLDCGGLERLAIDLAGELKAMGYNATICCLDHAGDLASDAAAKGVKIIVVGKKDGADFALPFKLANIMRREKVDVVHTHNLGPMVYGALGAKFAGIRTIINTRHGREKKETYAFFWNMNDAIIAISKDAKRRLVAFNLFDYAKLTVIYNGIRATSLKTDERAIKENIFGIDSKCKVAGTVSRLSEEKGQIVLLDAFSEVLQAVKDVRLVFVGDGPLKERLIEHSKELGIADKVIFLGFRKDAVEIMRAFDIFVLPSMTEGISLSLLEAMAAGKPTVVTHVGGNPEIVIHEVTGFLISPQALGKLSDAIIKLLQDEGLSKKMGEAGKKCVEESFTLDRMVDEYRSLYENCFSRKIMKRKV